MTDRGIDLPDRLIDPAHVAFAFSPDDINITVSKCGSAAHLSPPVRDWLWDVRREERAPPGLDRLLPLLGALVHDSDLVSAFPTPVQIQPT
jgi:hypothetical protein